MHDADDIALHMQRALGSGSTQALAASRLAVPGAEFRLLCMLAESLLLSAPVLCGTVVGG